MRDLSLVMPMAGRGSRFAGRTTYVPKPLIPLFGKPFFAWAVDSLIAAIPLRELVFVVLREHVDLFSIDREIVRRYPRARLVVVDEVTSGAAETAALGVEALRTRGPVAVNDCDHAFDATGLDSMVQHMLDGEADAGLLGFRSCKPAYSYAELDALGRVEATAEKKVISPFAIAGCYLFGSPVVYRLAYDECVRQRGCGELYLSSLFNALRAAGGIVDFRELAHHVAFGTPDELRTVTPECLRMNELMTA